MLRADVIGRSHLLYPEAFRDESDRIVLFSEREEGLDGDFRTLAGIHQIGGLG